MGRRHAVECHRSDGRAHRSCPPDTNRPPSWRALAAAHWRWGVGTLGRVLIAVGVLMFAFVGYQLWGTGIQTAQAQNRLEDEFNDLLEASAAPTTTSASAATVPPSTATDAPASTVTSDEPPPTTAPPEPLEPLARPELGQPLGRITIASAGIDHIVIEGVRTNDLADGPGHFPETPLPGQLGNAAIAGHRTTHGQPFIDIDRVQPGDEIVVQTLAGQYVYLVESQQIVSPNDYQLVIPTIDPTVATLTLTSCHPKYSARQRIVVTARLDEARSAPVTEPWYSATPPEPTGVIPGDDEPTPDTATAATTPTDATDPGAPGATIGAGAGDDGDEASAPSSSIPATTDGTDAAGAGSDAGEELFENRWFSDPDAFGQVALWGAVLSLVALAATALSWRVGRNWVGALAGAVPFVVVLYFFFENVNRLLPPNL
ncbi:MAG: class E sortase [Ilumatobacteraceae bacterium]